MWCYGTTADTTTAQRRDWSDLDSDIFPIHLINFQWTAYAISPKVSAEPINQ